jgi:hypothetical protein
MDNERAWFARRVVLSVLFVLIVAAPLYPEQFGLDEDGYTQQPNDSAVRTA